MPELAIGEILRALAVFDGSYKRAEVDAAIARREEVAPRLIEILEAVLSNPERAAENESYFGHVLRAHVARALPGAESTPCSGPTGEPAW